MQSNAPTVAAYLASLAPERRREVAAVRRLIRKNLPQGFREIMDFGMIAYVVPLSRYPKTYNGHPLGVAALASQKQYLSLYLMGVYGDPKIESWFHAAYQKSGKRLNMGKSCVRFRKADDLAQDVIADVLQRVTPKDLIRRYEASRKDRA